MTISTTKPAPDHQTVVAAAVTLLAQRGTPRRSRQWRCIFMNASLYVEGYYLTHPHKRRDKDGHPNTPLSIYICRSPMSALKRRRVGPAFLHVERTAAGTFEVLSYRPGAWERQLVRLAEIGDAK